MISNNSIQQVLDTASVQDVITDYVSLKKRGSNFIGLCPFHNEKTPSFSVSPSKNIYKCFGCGRGGNAVQFLMEHEKFSFPEAVRFLAKKYQIELEETQRTAEDMEMQSVQDSMYITMERAQTFFVDQLKNTDEGRNIGLNYFKSRGFLEKTIELFGLGYAPTAKNTFVKKALKEGFKKESLQKVGLSTRFDTDFFWNRVMFPIHGLSGKVIAFAGRIMGEQAKQAKYINSPENEIYEKRRVLYGIFQARKSIQNIGKCLLVEGYTDVISLHQSGIQNVVASSGTALTTDQIRLIKRYTSEIVLLYDGDKAGQAAADRGIDLILEQGMHAQIVLLPDQRDPDSYIREVGATKFLEYITEHGSDAILFKARKLGEESAHDPIKKSQLIDEVIQSLSVIPDPVKRSLYIKECSQIFGLAEETIVASLNVKIKSHVRRKQRERLREISNAEEAPLPETESPGQPIVLEAAYFQEKDIVRVLINYGNQFMDDDSQQTVSQYILSELTTRQMNHFEHEDYETILQAYSNSINTGDMLSFDEFKNHTRPSIRMLAVDLAHKDYTYSKNWAERWRIHLQMQKMPEENYVNDAKRACLRYLLSRYRSLSKENNLVVEKFGKENDVDKVEKHLKVQLKINGIIKELSEELGSVVN